MHDRKVLDRLGECWGVDRAEFEPISGATHGVFRCQIDGAQRVAKVFRTTEAAGTELRVLQLLAEADFPAPRVVEADAAGVRFGAAYVLMEDRGRENVAHRLAHGAGGIELARRMGELLAAAHAVRLPSPGMIRLDRIDPIDASSIEKKTHAAAVGLHAQKLIKRSTLEQVLAIEALPVEGDSLCHMDFHPVQCVVDGPGVAAVVDWEGAWAANPAIDLAVAHAYFDFYGAEKATDEFLIGYGARPDLVSSPSYIATRAMHLTSLAAKWVAAEQPAAAGRACEKLKTCWDS